MTDHNDERDEDHGTEASDPGRATDPTPAAATPGRPDEGPSGWAPGDSAGQSEHGHAWGAHEQWGPPPPPPPLGPPAGSPGVASQPGWSWTVPQQGGFSGADSNDAWGAPSRRPPRRKGFAIVAAVVAAAVLIASGVGIGWGISHSGDRQSSSSTLSPGVGGGSPVQPGGDGNPGGGNGGGTAPGGQVPSQGQPADPTTQAIADQVLPSVVSINTRIGTGVPGSNAEGGAAGSGMLLTSSGEVLTNNHVIRGATSIEVTVNGTSTYSADVVGADPSADVALLQIQDASGFSVVQPADTSNLTVGQSIVAIGNAYGQGGEPAATAGSITALEQTITAGDPGSSPERLSGLIQTNAPIAPGDSGGALVDTNGDVVGMITAASRTSAFSRTSTEGYAISIDDALAVVNRIHTGEATGDIILGLPGLLGVQSRDLDAAAAARLGLATTGGALVLQVVPGTPAADAGITAGSAITRIDGHAIGSADDLGTVMHGTKPGQQVSVTWVNGGGTHSATVRLITGPAV
jgi:S1-C subfamily serine protease